MKWNEWISPLSDIKKGWFPQDSEKESTQKKLKQKAEQKPNILIEISTEREYSRRDFWSSLPCCFGPTTSNIRQSTWCVFLTSDEPNECILSSQETTCVIASGLFSLLPQSNLSFPISLSEWCCSCCEEARSGQQQETRCLLAVPSLHLPNPHPKYWLAVGSAPGVILRFTSQWLAKVQASGESLRPGNQFWSAGMATFQSWTLGPDSGHFSPVRLNSRCYDRN